MLCDVSVFLFVLCAAQASLISSSGNENGTAHEDNPILTLSVLDDLEKTMPQYSELAKGIVKSGDYIRNASCYCGRKKYNQCVMQYIKCTGESERVITKYKTESDKTAKTKDGKNLISEINKCLHKSIKFYTKAAVAMKRGNCNIAREDLNKAKAESTECRSYFKQTSDEIKSAMRANKKLITCNEKLGEKRSALLTTWKDCYSGAGDAARNRNPTIANPNKRNKRSGKGGGLFGGFFGDDDDDDDDDDDGGFFSDGDGDGDSGDDDSGFGFGDGDGDSGDDDDDDSGGFDGGDSGDDGGDSGDSGDDDSGF